MTDDLVTRLLAVNLPLDYLDAEEAAHSAADEITRLRADLAAARELLEEARDAMDAAYDMLPERDVEETRLLNWLLAVVARIDAALGVTASPDAH